MRAARGRVLPMWADTESLVGGGALSARFLARVIKLLALGWSSFGLGILPPGFREFSRNWRRGWLGCILPVARGERKSGFLGCGELNPDPVFVSGAAPGIRPERGSKILRVRIVALAFAAIVAIDCRNSGVGLLVLKLFVLAVLVAVSLAFIRDRARKVEFARRWTIEPTDCGRGCSPNDVATAEVVPEGKGKDEQEESEQKNHVEEGKGLENAVASMIDLVRIAFDIVIYNDAVFFCPTNHVGIVNGRVRGDCTDSKPEDKEDANPEEFPSCLGDRAYFANTRFDEQSEEHEEGDDGGEDGEWHKHQRI
jgi:hypothetical protein